MPSLKMKANQKIGCMQERHGIHVSPQSTKISKTSLSGLKIVHNAEDVASIIQTTQPVSSIAFVVSQNKEHSIETAHDKSNEETFSRDMLMDQQNHASFTNLTTASCRMESMPASCTTSSDTIFSPILESIDIFGIFTIFESMPASCTTSSDTIFSPILESIDINSDSYLKYFEGDNNLSIPRLEAEDSDDSPKDTHVYYDCMSDFVISDMIFSAIPALGDSVNDGSTDFRFYPDPKCEEPIASFETDTERIQVPYLYDDDLEKKYVHDNRKCENATQSSESSLYLATHQLRFCSPESEIDNYVEADQEDCFDPHMFIRNMPDLTDLPSDMQSFILPKDRYKTKSITLVLDLDETLVHSTMDQWDDADFTFPVLLNIKERTVYVKQRPHLHTFLKRVAEMFDVVIFTASQSIYAKKILDTLDPDGKIFSRRAYRDSCLFSNGICTKDLTVLGVDLAKVVIIDNTPQVFRLQVNNGIPIKSWFNDPSDSELLSLLPFLETLADVDDVRPIIAKKFGNKD